MIEEKWKEMDEGYNLFISNLGRIFRKGYTMPTTCGRQNKPHTITLPDKNLIGTKLSTKGYQRVKLDKTYLVHRLVAKYWIPNPDNLPQVNHIDGNKVNNTSDNLEWVTNKENRQHAVENKLHAFGNRCAKKLTEKVVLEIKIGLSNGISQSDLAKKYNIAQQTVSKIKHGHMWSHVHLQIFPPASGNRVFGK